MTTTTKSLKCQVSPTGSCRWKIPGIGIDIMWADAGSPLILDKNVCRIQSLGSDDYYETREDAQKAVDAFMEFAKDLIIRFST